jgi:hypothetical protein
VCELRARDARPMPPDQRVHYVAWRDGMAHRHKEELGRVLTVQWQAAVSRHIDYVLTGRLQRLLDV